METVARIANVKMNLCIAMTFQYVWEELRQMVPFVTFLTHLDVGCVGESRGFLFYVAKTRKYGFCVSKCAATSA
jgi:hypothetical protein